MWKPGQIVTICGKRYRVKESSGYFICEKCAGRSVMHAYDEPCNTCLNSQKMPGHDYFEEIKPKSVMG